MLNEIPKDRERMLSNGRLVGPRHLRSFLIQSSSAVEAVSAMIGIGLLSSLLTSYYQSYKESSVQNILVGGTLGEPIDHIFEGRTYQKRTLSQYIPKHYFIPN
jgi:hypothetical protein